MGTALHCPAAEQVNTGPAVGFHPQEFARRGGRRSLARAIDREESGAISFTMVAFAPSSRGVARRQIVTWRAIAVVAGPGS